MRKTLRHLLAASHIIVRLAIVAGLLAGAHLGARWLDDDYDVATVTCNGATNFGGDSWCQSESSESSTYIKNVQETDGFLRYDAWSPFAFAGYHLGGLGLTLLALGLIALGVLASMSLFTWVFMGRLPLMLTRRLRRCKNGRCPCPGHIHNQSAQLSPLTMVHIATIVIGFTTLVYVLTRLPTLLR
jgi:hypothetical protein